MNKNFFDKRTVNIVTLALLSFIEALQVLIIVVLIFSFIPIPVPVFVQKLFSISLYDVRLERESFFYHVWIFTALGLQGLGLYLNREGLGEADLWRKYRVYISTAAVFIFVQIFAIFKIFLWGNPWWARGLFYLFLGGGIFVRIFWPEFWRLMKNVWSYSMTQKMPRWGMLLLDAGVLFIMTALVFAPDLNEVLARIFSYDKFYHLDGFVISPAWAHHTGLTLNRDVTSEYSLIMPIVFDGLMRVMGGFTYAHAVGIMIALSAIYYFLLYGLWRYWIGSFWLSFFAVLLCLKLQFFHWGVTPLIWIYINATPVRFFLDVFLLFFILRFTQSLKLRWLLAAALVSGLGLVWTLDVGVYMYVALVLSAVAAIYQKGTKLIPKVTGLLLLPWAIAFGILSIFYGPLIEQAYFWKNTFEFASLFMQGWGALPITEGLKDKQFFAFCMGFIIPTIYAGTLLYCAAMFLWRRSGAHLFMAIVCVYGLGLYHYFIHRSGVTSYYAVIIPFIFVLLHWLKILIGPLKKDWQRGIKLFLCAWALMALVTSYWYMYYPNWLNLSSWNWAPEKDFYTQQFDFSQDASLIDALTKPQEPVALITSFETKILIQANRRPFFYYFPFVESEQMQGDKLRGIYIHTYARLARTLKQLQEEPPSHIFIQKRLFEGKDAPTYENNHEAFKILMAYIRRHYQYQSEGKYLVALTIK